MELAHLLRLSGVADDASLLQARRMSEVMRLPLCHVALRYGYIDGKRLVLLLGKALELAPVDVDRAEVSPELIAAVPEDLSLALRVMPLAYVKEGTETVVALAMSDPTDTSAMRQIGRHLGLRARPLLAEDSALERAIRRHHAALRPPQGEEGGDVDVLPSIVGKLLAATASELAGEPDPFDPISADRTEDIPSIALDSYEEKVQGLFAATLDDAPMAFDTMATVVTPGPATGLTMTDPTDRERRVADKTRVTDLTKRRACFVCDEANTRRRLESDTRGLMESFYTEVSLAHVLDVGAEVDDVLLFRPKSDPRTHELLAKLARQQPKTRVVLIGAQPGLERAPGVVANLPAPFDADGVTAVVLDALARRS